MTEELKQVEMFFYYNDKKQVLWTSNSLFAELRADYYGTKEVFVEKFEIEE